MIGGSTWGGMAEYVAQVQAAAAAQAVATAEPKTPQPCGWCTHQTCSAPCNCKELCEAYDCEANGAQDWKGPGFARIEYGMPQFPKGETT